MLFGGVVPRATTFALCPTTRVTVYGWAVSPRKNGPVLVLNWKRYVTSGSASPFVSTFRLYRAFGENVYQFGPAAGSSPGMTLARIVTVPGLSGLRNAYRSVRSADGSSAISGASRWLDAAPVPGPRIVAPTAAAATSRPAVATRVTPLRICTPLWERQVGNGRCSQCHVGRFDMNRNATSGEGKACRPWPHCC